MVIGLFLVVLWLMRTTLRVGKLVMRRLLSHHGPARDEGNVSPTVTIVVGHLPNMKAIQWYNMLDVTQRSSGINLVNIGLWQFTTNQKNQGDPLLFIRLEI